MANARHKRKLVGDADGRGHKIPAGKVPGDILISQPELVHDYLRKLNRLIEAGHKFRDSGCECRVCRSK